MKTLLRIGPVGGAALHEDEIEPVEAESVIDTFKMARERGDDMDFRLGSTRMVIGYGALHTLVIIATEM